MRRFINAYIRACELRQRFKASNQSGGGLIQPIVVLNPQNTVGIDLTGPLIKTHRGNTYNLAVIGFLSEWAEIFALRDTKAKNVSQASFTSLSIVWFSCSHHL